MKKETRDYIIKKVKEQITSKAAFDETNLVLSLVENDVLVTFKILSGENGCDFITYIDTLSIDNEIDLDSLEYAIKCIRRENIESDLSDILTNASLIEQGEILE